MFPLKRHVTLTALLGGLALPAMGLSHLALTDIYHGEPNPVTEWTILQVSFFVFFLLALSSLSLAVRIHRINPGGYGDRQGLS